MRFLERPEAPDALTALPGKLRGPQVATSSPAQLSHPLQGPEPVRPFFLLGLGSPHMGINFIP